MAFSNSHETGSSYDGGSLEITKCQGEEVQVKLDGVEVKYVTRIRFDWQPDSRRSVTLECDTSKTPVDGTLDVGGPILTAFPTTLTIKGFDMQHELDKACTTCGNHDFIVLS